MTTEQNTAPNNAAVGEPTAESTAADTSAADTTPTPEQAYNGEYRPHPDRTDQSADDIAMAADIEEAMRDVVDPELGINVVDLGLVYDIWVERPESGEVVGRVDMTLTSAACPLTDVIEDQASSCVVGSGLVDSMKLNWVWMPPWGPEKITDDGREQLRALGFTV